MNILLHILETLGLIVIVIVGLGLSRKQDKQNWRLRNMANTLQDVRDAVAELQSTSAGLVESVEELLNKIEAGEDTADIVASLRGTIDSLKAADQKVESVVAGNEEIPTEPTA